MVALKPCCVEMCGILFVIYGSSVFFSHFAITKRNEMGLYDVPMFMPLLGLGTGMIFASFHMCGMILLQTCSSASPSYISNEETHLFTVLTGATLLGRREGTI